MSFKIHNELERRNDILIVSLDVKGAFDRVWWARLKNRLAARGTKGKALRLLEDYLHERHIQVVAGGKSSAKKEIFSGVPQVPEVADMPLVTTWHQPLEL